MKNPRQLIFPFSIDKKSSLSKFFVPLGSESLVKALSNKDGDDIVITGKKGFGKSYLLQSMCNDHSSDSFSVSYIPLREAIKLQPELLDGLESLDLVCIDDLENIASNKEWQVACFNLINHCSESGCRLIFSCMEGEDDFFPDLLSRLKKMTNYKINPTPDSQLADALKFIASNLRIPIKDREINFLLNTCSRDLPKLIVSLKEIDSLSMESKRKITIPLIKELL